MKKTLSILLAVVLMFAMAIPVFAAEETSSDTITSATGDSQHAVTAEFDKGSDNSESVAKVYYVTVDWTVNSTLKYSNGTTTYTWNAEDTQYTSETTGDGWTGSASVTIKVTNKSNDAITATPSWEAASPIEATCDFNTPKLDVASAATGVDFASGTLTGAAQNGTITATVNQPTAGSITENNAVVGTITVHIAAVED